MLLGWTYSISDHHERSGVVHGEVQAHLHAGIPTTNHKHLLPFKVRPQLVQTRMQYSAAKPVQAVDLGHHRLRILAGGDHNPPRHILRPVLGTHPPQPAFELGGDDELAEARPEAEFFGVGLQVIDELLPGRVLGEVGGERHEGELAELLGEVELQAVVGLVLPQGGYAVGALKE